VTNAELHAILQANLGTVREAARQIRAYVAIRS
jgi:hypothetical protein